jgi:hypothetical protein
MVLVLLINVKSSASESTQNAGSYATGISIEAKSLMEMKMVPDAGSDPISKLPFIPAPLPEAPHGKPVKAPHMEELPHIHRFHKERVKKMKQHHGKCWVLSQAILVVCHLSMLYIAYLHLTH